MHETPATLVFQKASVKPAQFEQVWHPNWAIQGTNNIGDLIECVGILASRLKQMQAAGVVLKGEIDGGDGLLVTSNPEIAERFGFDLAEDQGKIIKIYHGDGEILPEIAEGHFSWLFDNRKMPPLQ